LPLSSNIIDYYFSVSSSWSYIGRERFQSLVDTHNVSVRYHPLLSPDLFPATGGLLLNDRAQHRKDYRITELKRWRDYLGIEIQLEPKYFPVPETIASQMVLACEDPGALTSALLRAVWKEDRDVSDLKTLMEIANRVDLDGPALIAKSQTNAYAQAVKDETQAAIAAGVFGYPSYVYKGELFWGQDRLDFLERALEKNA